MANTRRITQVAESYDDNDFYYEGSYSNSVDMGITPNTMAQYMYNPNSEDRNLDDWFNGPGEPHRPPIERSPVGIGEQGSGGSGLSLELEGFSHQRSGQSAAGKSLSIGDEKLVKQVVEAVGNEFSREEILSALKTSSYSVEKAVDHLLNIAEFEDDLIFGVDDMDISHGSPNSIKNHSKEKEKGSGTRESDLIMKKERDISILGRNFDRDAEEGNVQRKKSGNLVGISTVSGESRFDFSTPSPDDIVKRKKSSLDTKPNEISELTFRKIELRDETKKSAVSSSALSFNLATDAPLSDGKEQTSRDSFAKKALNTPPQNRSQSGRQVSTTKTTTATIRGKSKQKLYEEHVHSLSAEREDDRPRGKRNINLVTIGHVDSGKSTLMGHLLYLSGVVGEKMMKKTEKKAKASGKKSFAYAWLLDENAMERERGVTIDVGTSMFETNTQIVTLLDSPGHKDFVPNMITGVAQADAAILLIDAKSFEAGFERGGQTMEHVILARAFGIEQLCVAINKMDIVKYQQYRFEEIVNKLKSFFKSAGFGQVSINYIPVSGFTGENLLKPSKNLLWFKGPTLVSAIESYTVREALKKSHHLPLRFCAIDADEGNLSLFGRVEVGGIMTNDEVRVFPCNCTATVTSLVDESGNRIEFAVAGQNIEVNLRGDFESNEVGPGNVVCPPNEADSVLFGRSFKAKVAILFIEDPIIPGYACEVHHMYSVVPGRVRKILSVEKKKKGAAVSLSTRFINTDKVSALIELELDYAICYDLERENTKARLQSSLSRVVIRSQGKTIAVGFIVC